MNLAIRSGLRTNRLAALLSTTSLLVLSQLTPAKAQGMVEGGNEQVSEQVLITGSLIHGAAAVGVPVLGLSEQDFQNTGALTTTDLFKDVPFANAPSFQSSTDAGSKIEQTESINIRGLSTKGARTLLLVDGMRFPPQGDGGCQVDPSIIPQLALSRVDILADGASAVYGSDAVAGVVNIILKRGFDGSITQAQFGVSPDIGNAQYRFSELFGRTWDGGDIAVTYEWYDQNHVEGLARPYYTQNFNAIDGLDNRTPLLNSQPGTISIGKPVLPAGSPTTITYANTSVPGVPGSFSATTGTACGNCYAIPTGQNGQSLTWAAVLANNLTPTSGTKNEINPFSTGWETPGQARDALVVTFDQKVFPDVQLFVDGFYDNRRSVIRNPTGASPLPSQNNALALAIPTGNPFIPMGSPTGLMVYYDLTEEMPIRIDGNEVAERYDGGFNVDLPFNWTGKIFGSVTEDEQFADARNLVNPTQASAALGWTIPAGNTLASFAKPANVPYLNVFCDPFAYTCNSAATLQYISGFRNLYEEMIIREYGANADGTIYTLPAGDLKGAIGTVYDDYSYFDSDIENYNNPGTAQVTTLTEARRRQVAAVFGQLNIPVINEAMNIPLIEKLNFEGSVRYDHYDLYGGTTNPRVAADWLVADGLTLQSSWGTSFRAPSFQESGAVSGTTIQPVNSPAGAATNTKGTCPVVGAPAVAGSVAALIDPNCAASLQFLGGITLGNGAGIATAVRPAGFALTPETSQNISEGFEWAPTDGFFKGLDLQFTYYFVKIRNKLQGCSGTLDDPNTADCFVTPQVDDGAPNTQAAFNAQVLAILTNGRSGLSGVGVATNISYIADGAIRNIGWQSTNGVDFTDNYDWTMGDLGAWNIGVLGEYIIDNKSVTGPGQPIISVYSTAVNGERDSGGRLRYRAHLGWAGGPDDAWTVTGFMNFIPHYNVNQGSLPPLCFLEGNTPCNVLYPSAQFAQYTQQFPTLSNYIPGIYTFDLAIGYKTGDRPANDYLKNLGVQLTITNLFNKAPPFQYSIASSANTPHAFDNALSVDQRFVTIIVTKAF